jgi:hypothetical protein
MLNSEIIPKIFQITIMITENAILLEYPRKIKNYSRITKISDF